MKVGPEESISRKFKPITLRQSDGTFETGNTVPEWNLKALKASHETLAEWDYDLSKINRGYAGRTLHVNLSTKEIVEKPVTDDMMEKFTGGKGFGVKLLWDSIRKETKWNDEDNSLVMTSGPLCGSTQYPGSGKSLAVTVSPSTDLLCDSNAGGYFAPYLKFSGFDAIEVTGKAEEDVIIFLDGRTGKVTIETAPTEEIDSHLLAEQLTHLYAYENTERERQKVAVVSSGSGAAHSYWGILNISFWDPRRKVARLKQHGRGGLGTVLTEKKVRAIVARIEHFDGMTNDPADPETMAITGHKLDREMRDLDKSQCNMRTVGTGNIVEVMDAYDLLPVENYRFGTHPRSSNLHSPNFYKRYTQVIPDGCWHGCTMACAKSVDGFEVQTGPYKGTFVSVEGPEYENSAGGANMGIFEPDWVLEWNFYCDTYGLDTISVATGFAFYMEMYEYNILDKRKCDGLELRFGNADAAMELLHRIASGYGSEFATVAGRGVRRMKDWLISNRWGDPALIEDTGMEVKGLEYSEYVTKESLAQQGGYGMASKGPQHDEAWLIFMDMVNKQLPTFKDKAEALHYFPLWRTWLGLTGTCKLVWNDVVPTTNAQTSEPAKVPEHVANYAAILGATLGKDVSSQDLIDQSERVYNWQRAMNVWMGKGRRSHDRVPYRSVGPVTEVEYISRTDRYDGQLVDLIGLTEDAVEKMNVTEKMAVLREYREDQYQRLQDAVYLRRGWTQNGVPTTQKMKALGFGDETQMLEMLQAAIDADEAAGLNKWGANYGDEEPPSPERQYWLKW